ncbi:tc5 transposase DNA-binding domain-containing protein [Ditylenchus destructor]|uniref:Tc5 transposase DNA-binding domain-containing protein n=1 Tax=Ditylenchus destructor TaxID=166010 RepID=A0AAD4MP66_9BILA|nr:tc5 transposase DNA-binding domain-containing protein [Ditylenchus destructor]
MNSLELPTEEEEEYFANLESYSDDEPSSSKKPRKLKSYPPPKPIRSAQKQSENGEQMRKLCGSNFFKMNRAKNVTANIWRIGLYTKKPDEEIAICTVCCDDGVKCEFSVKDGTTSTLIKHLKTKHPDSVFFTRYTEMVLRDGGANIKKCFQTNEFFHADCGSHLLNLVVRDSLKPEPISELLKKCRAIVGHFKHSNSAMDHLKDLQIENELPSHMLLQDMPVRWNCAYYMAMTFTVPSTSACDPTSDLWKEIVDYASKPRQTLQMQDPSDSNKSTACDPMDWWKNNSKNFPLLSKFAKRYLTPDCTTRMSEGLFSTARNVNTSTVAEQPKRLPGGGRQLKYKDIDDQLAAWVRSEISQGACPSRRQVRNRALTVYNVEADGSDFTASNGWLEAFMSRHRFSGRLRTTACQKAPAEFAAKLVNFVMFVSKLREQVPFQHIYACDETGVWLDPVGGKYVAEKGAKQVSVRTTGHERKRITVLLTAGSDGKKKKPFVLLDRKRPVPQIVEQFKELELCWAGRTWVKRTYLGLSQARAGPRTVQPQASDLGRVSLPPEPSNENNAEAAENSAVVPGGCTKYVQAPDLSWNAPFKAKIRELYDIWIANQDRMEYTKQGNMKAPSMEVYLEWIRQAWAALPEELIRKSFKECGLTINLDGSEDDMIHCFKPHGPVPGGRELLRKAREDSAEVEPLIMEEDPEENKENGATDSEQELVIEE